MSGQRKLALASVAMYTGFLCLLQATCEPTNKRKDNDGDLTKQATQLNEGTQEVAIEPDKFGLTIEELNYPNTNKHFVRVQITPGSRDMNLKELFITAAVAKNQGTLKGAGRKQGTTLKYNVDLEDQSLANIYLTLGRLGSEDTSFQQGEPVAFRLSYEPNLETKKGDEYTLTVKIERKGSNPHTEETTLVLTAK